MSEMKWLRKKKNSNLEIKWLTKQAASKKKPFVSTISSCSPNSKFGSKI